MGQGYGNPFLHHMTWRIVPPECEGTDYFGNADQVVPLMAEMRRKIGGAIGEPPGTLLCALPQKVIGHTEFETRKQAWVAGMDEDKYQFETMQGGGFFIQFFCLTGGKNRGGAPGRYGTDLQSQKRPQNLRGRNQHRPDGLKPHK